MIGRRMVAAGIVVAAVTAGGVAGAVIGIPGLSSASSSSSPPTSSAAPAAGRHFRGSFGPAMGADRGLLDAAAKALNLSTSDLLQKLSDGKTTIADVAGQQKVSVQSVIDAMEAVAKTDISNLVNNPLPARPGFNGAPPMMGGSGGVGGPMHGHFGFGFGFGLGRGGPLGGAIDGVAKALGISTQDLLSDLGKGQSIADIAKSKNVDIDTLIKTLVSDATTQIDAAVKAGHLDRALATKLESNLKDLITKAVNSSMPKFGGHIGFGRRDGRGYVGTGGYGPGGPVPGYSAPTPPAGQSN